MGRRSINTTKSGKYMNPTDQARKEARKKELKKNKRQRQMVRAAVLKMKDPTQILEELQKIDEMEFNVLQPSPLNEKVLKEKRKKLRETFDRVLKMYDKDDSEKWVELKRQEIDYEKRRAHLISYYESVKHAQSVQVDDIPLPALQLPENLLFGNMPSQIPLPMDTNHLLAPKPILKKDSMYKEKPVGVEPPGVPPGPPVPFAVLLLEQVGNKERKSLRFADEDVGPPGEAVIRLEVPKKRILVEVEIPGICDDCMVDAQNPVPPPNVMQAAPPVENFDGEIMDDADHSLVPPNATPKPTSLQQRMLALSGQNIDEFMKEMEEVHKKRERDRAADLNARLSALKRPSLHAHEHTASDSDSDAETSHAHHEHHEHHDLQLEPPGAELRPPPALVAPAAFPAHVAPMPPPGIRPPPLHGPLVPPLRMPPRPAPPGPPPGLPRAILRPPGPPPGAPPRLLRPLVPPPPPKAMPQVSVLTAAPQLISKKDGPQGATITAKPQIRNLSADVTRFVPSALRVKREDKKSKPIKSSIQRPVDVPKQAPSKDDAYMQFMKEMEGLL